MRIRINGLALVFATVSTGAAAEALPFDGKWATDLANCGLAAPDGERHAPITISASQLIAPGVMTCDFTSVLPGGMSYRVEATCEAIGQRGIELFTLAVLDGRLYWTWGGKTGTFDRCP